MSTPNITRQLNRDYSFQRRDSALLAGLLSDFDNLLDNQATADVHFMVDQEQVTAHKLIVLARCERYRNKKKFSQQADSNSPIVIQLGKHFSAAAVRDVVVYLYTGKISLHNDAPFSLLQVCVEFGLPLLQSYLTHHVTSNLTPNTVCHTLVGASSLMKTCRDDSLKLALRQIVQDSRTYIRNHQNLVLEGKGLLEMSKEALLGVLSDPELTLGEEEVWRAVVRWGQHKARVPRPSQVWSDDDRSQVKLALDGILQHVQVMEIDSEVFANEVEPTGLLPVETMLAHYRHAAVSASSANGYSGRGSVGSLRSSNSIQAVQEPFVESAIMAGKLEMQLDLQEWIEPCRSPQCPPQDWTLLYRASRDGFSAREFHSHCDERGPTVTVIKMPGDRIFGGYSESSWSSRSRRGKFASSQEAFLFLLQGQGDSPPTRYPIHQPAYAINNHPGNGPIFGSGADLFISDHCNSNQDSYSQLGHSYGDSTLPPDTLTGDSYFIVEDYEVFGLST